ncbi:hypothetical protein HOY80DRAFT_986297 [Tuber brumale]|nr:hypothetical protein HOY80DRAFT_986297 [Tuber brumale]
MLLLCIIPPYGLITGVYLAYVPTPERVQDDARAPDAAIIQCWYSTMYDTAVHVRSARSHPPKKHPDQSFSRTQGLGSKPHPPPNKINQNKTKQNKTRSNQGQNENKS